LVVQASVPEIVREVLVLKTDSRLKPVKEFRVCRRNLPHYEDPGSVYFVTFTTAPGYNLTDAAKDITFAAIRFHADKKYKLYACVVMTTHVHIILLPLEASKDNYYSLAQIMHSIKSYSANKIQRAMNKKGSVWLDENYDRIVRNDNDLMVKINYIINNPLKAGLADRPEDYKWLFYQGLD
jgi:REP element-mobilizing transposase RayT